MGACCSVPLSPDGNDVELTILVLGVDNSGKTTLTQTINGEYDANTVPTVGFAAPVRKKLFGCKAVFYDLGGGSRIRGVWPQYYADVHGLIYVVDASDGPRLEESRQELEQVVSHPMVSGKPLLIFANKSDVPGSLSLSSLGSALGLDGLSTSQHRVVPITASVPALLKARTGETGKGTAQEGDKKPDERIFDGLRWLIDCIQSSLPELEARRVTERAAHKASEDAKRKERLARLQQAEKDRDKAKEAAAAGSLASQPAQASSASATPSHGSSAQPSAEAGAQQPAAPAARRAAPAEAQVPLCKLCKTAPAVRRSAAAGWEAVCDPCGTRAEEERDRKRRAAEQEEEQQQQQQGQGEKQTAAAGGQDRPNTPSASPTRPSAVPPSTPPSSAPVAGGALDGTVLGALNASSAASPGPTATAMAHTPYTPAMINSVQVEVQATPAVQGTTVGHVDPQDPEVSVARATLNFDEPEGQGQAALPSSPGVTVVQVLGSPVPGHAPQDTGFHATVAKAVPGRDVPPLQDVPEDVMLPGARSPSPGLASTPS